MTAPDLVGLANGIITLDPIKKTAKMEGSFLGRKISVIVHYKDANFTESKARSDLNNTLLKIKIYGEKALTKLDNVSIEWGSAVESVKRKPSAPKAAIPKIAEQKKWTAAKPKGDKKTDILLEKVKKDDKSPNLSSTLKAASSATTAGVSRSEIRDDDLMQALYNLEKAPSPTAADTENMRRVEGMIQSARALLDSAGNKLPETMEEYLHLVLEMDSLMSHMNALQAELGSPAIKDTQPYERIKAFRQEFGENTEFLKEKLALYMRDNFIPNTAVKQDGNCLFWSFSMQLGKENQQVYRKMAMDYIRAYPDQFKDDEHVFKDACTQDGIFKSTLKDYVMEGRESMSYKDALKQHLIALQTKIGHNPDFLDIYCDCMENARTGKGKMGCWGGPVEIKALSLALRRPVFSFSPSVFKNDEWTPSVFCNIDLLKEGKEPLFFFYNGVNHYQDLIPLHKLAFKPDILKVSGKPAAKPSGKSAKAKKGVQFAEQDEARLYFKKSMEQQKRPKGIKPEYKTVDASLPKTQSPWKEDKTKYRRGETLSGQSIQEKFGPTRIPLEALSLETIKQMDINWLYNKAFDDLNNEDVPITRNDMAARMRELNKQTVEFVEDELSDFLYDNRAVTFPDESGEAIHFITDEVITNPGQNLDLVEFALGAMWGRQEGPHVEITPIEDKKGNRSYSVKYSIVNDADIDALLKTKKELI